MATVRGGEPYSFADLVAVYPYIGQLYKDNPPAIWNDPNLDWSGLVQGTRYERDPSIPRLAILNPALNGLSAPNIGHEYGHFGIDVSPNWSYIIPPEVGQRMNQPKSALNYPAAQGLGLGNLYPRRIQVEEGMLRSLFPDSEIARTIQRRPGVYFTPDQQAIMPMLKKYLQYGPTWGSMVGDEKSGYIVDPTYRGVQVKNPDGTVSSELTMGVEIGGTHYLIPTLYRGRALRKDDAVKMFKQGMLPAVGMAGTKDELDEMARARSKMLGEEGRQRGIEFAPPARTRNVSPESKPLYSPGMSTGKAEVEPEPYTWSDVVAYP